jgi:hypothetical protein
MFFFFKDLTPFYGSLRSGESDVFWDGEFHQQFIAWNGRRRFVWTPNSWMESTWVCLKIGLIGCPQSTGCWLIIVPSTFEWIGKTRYFRSQPDVSGWVVNAPFRSIAGQCPEARRIICDQGGLEMGLCRAWARKKLYFLSGKIICLDSGSHLRWFKE